MSSLIPDPFEPGTYVVANASSFKRGKIGSIVIRNVHPPSRCAGKACVIHNPSEHSMRSWPMSWREDIGLMERLCEHGIGHPDPDSAAILMRRGFPADVHTCDGCCGYGKS